MSFPFRAVGIDADTRHMDEAAQNKTSESKIKGNKLKHYGWTCYDGYIHELY